MKDTLQVQVDRIQQAKSDLAAVITEKGVPTTTQESLDVYGDHIRKIEQASDREGAYVATTTYTPSSSRVENYKYFLAYPGNGYAYIDYSPSKEDEDTNPTATYEILEVDSNPRMMLARIGISSNLVSNGNYTFNSELRMSVDGGLSWSVPTGRGYVSYGSGNSNTTYYANYQVGEVTNYTPKRGDKIIIKHLSGGANCCVGFTGVRKVKITGKVAEFCYLGNLPHSMLAYTQTVTLGPNREVTAINYLPGPECDISEVDLSRGNLTSAFAGVKITGGKLPKVSQGSQATGGKDMFSYSSSLPKYFDGESEIPLEDPSEFLANLPAGISLDNAFVSRSFSVPDNKLTLVRLPDASTFSGSFASTSGYDTVEGTLETEKADGRKFVGMFQGSSVRNASGIVIRVQDLESDTAFSESFGKCPNLEQGATVVVENPSSYGFGDMYRSSPNLKSATFRTSDISNSDWKLTDTNLADSKLLSNRPDSWRSHLESNWSVLNTEALPAGGYQFGDLTVNYK